jgi:hypothetical protein
VIPVLTVFIIMITESCEVESSLMTIGSTLDRVIIGSRGRYLSLDWLLACMFVDSLYYYYGMIGSSGSFCRLLIADSELVRYGDATRFVGYHSEVGL